MSAVESNKRSLDWLLFSKVIQNGQSPVPRNDPWDLWGDMEDIFQFRILG